MARPDHTPTGRCVVCDAVDIRDLMSTPDVPIHCNVLWPTREEARRAPRGEVNLGYCRVCGHVFNTTFDPSLMEYTQEYENSLHFSPRFQSYAEALARRLVERYSIRNKDVIDVGCGKGDFLALVCGVGDNRGTGFDPSYVPGQLESAGSGRMTIVRDFYSPKYSSYKADLITCRHVLEHIQFPGKFVGAIAQSIEGRPETVVFFEVPNVLYSLRDMGIWDIIYEHCSYFSSSSLARLFTDQGFTVLEQTELYDGQYLGIDVMARGAGDTPVVPTRPEESMGDLVDQFSRKYREKIASWKEQISRMADEGRTVVVWGGGSKGVTFLNAMGEQDLVRYMVDINPRKQGMFVPGTGQEVIGPETLGDLRPNIVVIMNPVYRGEIQSTLSDLGIEARVMVA